MVCAGGGLALDAGGSGHTDTDVFHVNIRWWWGVAILTSFMLTALGHAGSGHGPSRAALMLFGVNLVFFVPSFVLCFGTDVGVVVDDGGDGGDDRGGDSHAFSLSTNVVCVFAESACWARHWDMETGGE